MTLNELLDWIENEASLGMAEGDTLNALNSIKWKIKDCRAATAVAPTRSTATEQQQASEIKRVVLDKRERYLPLADAAIGRQESRYLRELIIEECAIVADRCGGWRAKDIAAEIRTMAKGATTATATRGDLSGRLLDLARVMGNMDGRTMCIQSEDGFIDDGIFIADDHLPTVHDAIRSLEAQRSTASSDKVRPDAEWLTAKHAEFDNIFVTTPTPSAAMIGKALADVAAERQRQISKEGWTTAHDDEHDGEQLATAAACYALGRAFHVAYDVDQDDEFLVNGREIWPWDIKWWKPKSRREDLVRAGALILAEIERLDRADALSRNDRLPTEVK